MVVEIFMIYRTWASNKISSFEHLALIMLLQPTSISNYIKISNYVNNQENLKWLFLTNPGPVQIYWNKGGRDGEVVDKGVKLEHEPELVGGGDEPDEEVDHEEDVEGKVDLLKPVLAPGYTLFYPVIAGWMWHGFMDSWWNETQCHRWMGTMVSWSAGLIWYGNHVFVDPWWMKFGPGV